MRSEKSSTPATRPGRPCRAVTSVTTDSTVLRQPAADSVLSQFDQLPDSALVRVGVVSGLLGCSISTVWRLSKLGKLPSPVKLSDAITGWRVGELRRVLSGVAE